MITKDFIRNMRWGTTATVRCSDAADMDSTYQTALQVRKELGITSDIMGITRKAKELTVIIDLRPQPAEQP